MAKKIWLAGLLLLAIFAVAGQASAATAVPYYYGQPQATQAYFNGIDPIIAEPNYLNPTQSFTYRDYFFNQNFPISAASVAYEPLRSEERFPYGNVYSYDVFTGLTYYVGSKGQRPYDYRYNNNLAVLDGRNAAPVASAPLAQTNYMAAPAPMAAANRPSYQYLDGLAYQQPAPQGIDFEAYARGAAYR